MDKVQALNAFWNGFGIPAYDENSVPDDLQLPYITYNVTSDNIGNVVSLHAILWYKSTSWREITLKQEEIAEKIGYGHLTIPFDKGYIYLARGTPFAQRYLDTDDSVKSIYINLQAEFLCEY